MDKEPPVRFVDVRELAAQKKQQREEPPMKHHKPEATYNLVGLKTRNEGVLGLRGFGLG